MMGKIENIKKLMEVTEQLDDLDRQLVLAAPISVMIDTLLPVLLADEDLQKEIEIYLQEADPSQPAQPAQATLEPIPGRENLVSIAEDVRREFKVTSDLDLSPELRSDMGWLEGPAALLRMAAGLGISSQ